MNARSRKLQQHDNPPLIDFSAGAACHKTPSSAHETYCLGHFALHADANSTDSFGYTLARHAMVAA